MTNLSFAEDTDWRCCKCDKELKPISTEVKYLNSVFKVDLMRCPKCGFTLIPEELATGKMFDVEQLLEDK
jgi:DNA-directed RNA polymerase subunit RPC12/RpoP